MSVKTQTRPLDSSNLDVTMFSERSTLRWIVPENASQITNVDEYDVTTIQSYPHMSEIGLDGNEMADNDEISVGIPSSYLIRNERDKQNA